MSEKPIALTQPPEGYATWLAELKNKIHQAQQRATLAVNQELIALYWQIGRDILDRQAAQGWGAKVIDHLAHDLRTAFPDMKGFSPRNLKYMRAFAQAWPDAEFVQAVLAQLPWYHQLALLDKLPSQEARRWYAAKAIENNWSRDLLFMQSDNRVKQPFCAFNPVQGHKMLKPQNRPCESAQGDRKREVTLNSSVILRCSSVTLRSSPVILCNPNVILREVAGSIREAA
ncbi:MAG TPA: DUF1016 N-terminal domain-containing protein [Cellvibrionaceae bacterium]